MCFPFCGTGRIVRIARPLDTSLLTDAINRFEDGRAKDRRGIKRIAKKIADNVPAMRGDVVAILNGFGYGDCIPSACRKPVRAGAAKAPSRRNCSR